MSVIASTGFGAFVPPTPKIMRMPVNEFDKSTIVTVYPKEIHELKPTLFPGVFSIPACGGKDQFELLVVGPSSWFKEMEEGQPFLEIPTSSVQVAESVVLDYVNGILGCNMGDVMPGLFFIPGEWTKQSILKYVDKKSGKSFVMLLAEAREKQKKWFGELVKIADTLWARTNGNPLSISDDARMAAEQLGLQKSWMQDFKQMELDNCPSCGELVNKSYPVCKHCKAIINQTKANELGLKFAV